MNKELSRDNQHNLTLMPKAGPCYDFVSKNLRAKRSIWMVPHIIKHRNGAEIIIWRCNLGNICESDCLYAMAKKRTSATISLHSIRNKILV